MNDIIRIEPEMFTSMSVMYNILDKFEELDKIFYFISLSLDNTNKWDGKVHDKCVGINNILSNYSKSISSLCDELKDSILDLKIAVEHFVSESSCCEKL